MSRSHPQLGALAASSSVVLLAGLLTAGYADSARASTASSGTVSGVTSRLHAGPPGSAPGLPSTVSPVQPSAVTAPSPAADDSDAPTPVTVRPVPGQPTNPQGEVTLTHNPVYGEPPQLHPGPPPAVVPPAKTHETFLGSGFTSTAVTTRAGRYALRWAVGGPFGLVGTDSIDGVALDQIGIASNTVGYSHSLYLTAGRHVFDVYGPFFASPFTETLVGPLRP